LEGILKKQRLISAKYCFASASPWFFANTKPPMGVRATTVGHNAGRKKISDKTTPPVFVLGYTGLYLIPDFHFMW
jgi:hypothetical protein